MQTVFDIVLYILAGIGLSTLLVLLVLWTAFRILKSAVARYTAEQAKANERMDAIIKQHMGDIETTTPDKVN